MLRDGLRLVEPRDAEDRARIQAVGEAARIGIADIEEGRFRPFDSAAALRRWF